MSLVSRDPFARTEIHRELKFVGKTTCQWCGQHRHYKGKPTDKLYQFRLEPDAGRPSEFSGLFCTTRCFRTYHEIAK